MAKESVCEYFHFCTVTKLTGRDCSHPAYESCQTFKFFEKHGTDYNGVGAMTKADVSRLEREVEDGSPGLE
tara:strand:+ start:141 stop:353 length:213 start_codon:yes stop_codon:yes gene_type:complete